MTDVSATKTEPSVEGEQAAGLVAEQPDTAQPDQQPGAATQKPAKERTAYFMKAMAEGLGAAMAEDDAVVVLGEDVDRSIIGGTRGLIEKFGPERVRNTPISEATFVGACVGAAAVGLKPVVDLMIGSFFYVAMDQVANQAAKLRYMSGGKAKVPMVVRTLYGTGMRRGAQHSQTLYPLFAHIPGLKVAVPSNPHDAKGLMVSAIRDDDPVLFFEHKMLYFIPGPVPAEPYAIPFGEAAVVRPGDHCTVVALGRMVQFAQQAAAELAATGIECEVIDPRTVSPLDTATIYASVEKTGRLVVADEANPRCGLAADIAARVAQDRFDALRGPVRMVTPPHSPQPFSPVLEDAYLPGPGHIVTAVRTALGIKEEDR
jgi:pyruvate dehydrogenase E1 component beta subunit